MIRIGFERPRDRTRGLHHYGLNIGVEIVGSALLDGAGRRDKVVVVDVGEGLEVAFIGAEDLIAERVAQYQSSPATMQSRLDQALAVWQTWCTDLDPQHLDKQIRHEAPGLTLAWLERTAVERGIIPK